MQAIKILAALGGEVVREQAVRGHHRRQISRLNLIIAFALCASVIALAAYPPLFDPVLRTFDFQRGTDGIVFALLVAVGVLFFLYLRAQITADTNERGIRLLVEALGVERFDWVRAAALPAGRRIVVVLPAFNEADNVGAVIGAMPDAVAGLRVVPVVVSDGSTDGTAAAAREAGALVTELPINRGGGLALRVGYEIALELSAEIVVTMDADGQHQPSELSRLVGPIVEGEVDVVGGSRVLGSADPNHAARELGIKLFAQLLSVLTWSRVTDPACGYRAVRTEALRGLEFRQDQFHNSEFIVEASKRKLRSREVPVTITQRLSGDSKKPAHFRYGMGFANALMRAWLR